MTGVQTCALPILEEEMRRRPGDPGRKDRRPLCRARQNYESLSEAEKEEIILRCKDAKSKDEMDKILNSISTPGDITGLLQEKSMG